MNVTEYKKTVKYLWVWLEIKENEKDIYLVLIEIAYFHEYIILYGLLGKS